ncbi:hypothetical protein LLEC1_01869 [Akanthomyces lecanii]|uniref:Uncharacterized protein n=1 Tax=Cordyceps confragosa TaxID=2714763 RepID=A0A179IC71_CORDF|nr:hypothetical protein LLEC1_01869 [Akanthomyces lecanii]
MGRARRKWSPEEDALLRKVVSAAITESRPLLWRELAKTIPGRSNKDCRRRWWNSLADGTAKGPWSESEDAKLIHAVKEAGTNWRVVAQYVGSRTSDQCSSHWQQVLDPEINHCNWTSLEDDQLLHETLLHGTNWTTISASHVPKRTTLALKNRYSRLRSKNGSRRKGRKLSETPKPRNFPFSGISNEDVAEISFSCFPCPDQDGQRRAEPEPDQCGRRGSDTVNDGTDDMESGTSTMGSVSSADLQLGPGWASFSDASNQGCHLADTDGAAFSQLWSSNMEFSTYEECQSLLIDPAMPFEGEAELFSLATDPFTLTP